MNKYYVEHLVFSLYYYSFDFFCKSVFALAFIASAAAGLKMPSLALNFFYPIALIYLTFALKRVYQQKWPITVVKSVALFLCETLLFIGINVVGFIIALTFI
jgi:NADH:ubiquinone oxidoreductase subunit 3 (subunit A)